MKKAISKMSGRRLWRWKTLWVLLACLLASQAVVFAQEGRAEGEVKRYPWDNRFEKCFGSPEALMFPDCRLENWPSFPESKQRIDMVIAGGDVELIERAIEELATSGSKFATGEYYFEAAHLSMRQFQEMPSWNVALVNTWVKELGRNGFSCLAEAMLDHGKAWEARGGGYAHTVSPEGWALYRKHLGTAMEKLHACPGKVKASGAWTLAELQMTFEDPKQRGRRLEVLASAADRWPDSVAVYEIPMRFAHPRWGGSFAMMDEVAMFAAERSKERLGEGMYAIAYERMFGVRTDGAYTLRDTRINWERAKLGFRDVERAKRGQPRIWRNFAMMACQMRDRDEARRLLEMYDKQRAQASPLLNDGCREFAFAAQ
jgi:hypothetical protein